MTKHILFSHIIMTSRDIIIFQLLVTFAFRLNFYLNIRKKARQRVNYREITPNKLQNPSTSKIHIQIMSDVVCIYDSSLIVRKVL